MSDAVDLTRQENLAHGLPHRPPFRLVDRLLSRSENEAISIRRVTADDPLIGDCLALPLLVDALAQTAALMHSAELGAHRGYLVALRDVHFEGSIVAGDTLTLHVRHLGSLGTLRRVEGEARVDGRVVARGELTLAIEAA